MSEAEREMWEAIQLNEPPLPRLKPATEGSCSQGCGAPATVYAIDPIPGGWGGRYCEPCAKALRFSITDRL